MILPREIQGFLLLVNSLAFEAQLVPVLPSASSKAAAAIHVGVSSIAYNDFIHKLV